jgi:hypothetical protein
VTAVKSQSPPFLAMPAPARAGPGHAGTGKSRSPPFLAVPGSGRGRSRAELRAHSLGDPGLVGMGWGGGGNGGLGLAGEQNVDAGAPQGDPSTLCSLGEKNVDGTVGSGLRSTF